ncbi:hypothetical protein Msil_2436 [Methylocella silvestris BL2]|uniref:Uncharacterized protein n=1 Tax=Methylocella silvestris (strain DSM 15510 / CIP 108128 / LMG 27833 / NCIMB 13906 / BL2) TaxID=395965 RepID=B8EKJ5_METSB|nr:hypothetical protein [Methylocella silvestris]ACK51365.1 hypothetical protein Msil_2436 [Methylocella silvestris BL2]
MPPTLKQAGLFMFDFLLKGAELRFDLSEPLPLRDLVAGLRSGGIEASAILNRLDPDLADEIHAVAVHRGVTTESYLAGALVNFALEAADEAWRRLGERAAPIDADQEAAAFGVLLSEALRRTLTRDARISSGVGAEPAAKKGRRVATLLS